MKDKTPEELLEHINRLRMEGKTYAWCGYVRCGGNRVSVEVYGTKLYISTLRVNGVSKPCRVRTVKHWKDHFLNAIRSET